jgi:hypothetical protein
MTGPQLALGPWWTRDHGATRLLQGSRGRGDSSERERERGGRRGSHQWRHLAAELWRWSHDGAQKRRPVVLRWGDGSRREEERLTAEGGRSWGGR